MDKSECELRDNRTERVCMWMGGKCDDHCGASVPRWIRDRLLELFEIGRDDTGLPGIYRKEAE